MRFLDEKGLTMASQASRQFVWDFPTRIFHWSLVILLGFSWWSAETYHMDWHRYSGLTVCGLVVFRLLWGLFGTRTSRFTQFVRGPRTVLAHLRPGGMPSSPVPLGHNPAGGWAVIVMLLLLCVQIISGLFAVDIDGIESGPLSHLVDFDQGRTASDIHGWSFLGLQIMVVVHVLAIIFYLVVKRRNLTWAMITGYQRTVDGAEPAGASRVAYWRLFAAIVVAAALAYAVSKGFRF